MGKQVSKCPWGSQSPSSPFTVFCVREQPLSWLGYQQHTIHNFSFSLCLSFLITCLLLAAESNWIILPLVFFLWLSSKYTSYQVTFCSQLNKFSHPSLYYYIILWVSQTFSFNCPLDSLYYSILSSFIPTSTVPYLSWGIIHAFLVLFLVVNSLFRHFSTTETFRNQEPLAISHGNH